MFPYWSLDFAWTWTWSFGKMWLVWPGYCLHVKACLIADSPIWLCGGGLEGCGRKTSFSSRLSFFFFFFFASTFTQRVAEITVFSSKTVLWRRADLPFIPVKPSEASANTCHTLWFSAPRWGQALFSPGSCCKGVHTLQQAGEGASRLMPGHRLSSALVLFLVKDALQPFLLKLLVPSACSGCLIADVLVLG